MELPSSYGALGVVVVVGKDSGAAAGKNAVKKAVVGSTIFLIYKKITTQFSSCRHRELSSVQKNSFLLSVVLSNAIVVWRSTTKLL